MIDWFLFVDFGFRWNQLPSFFVLFLVSFDGFILIHMPHFVNTDFIFFCYFSVLFLPWMTAISFYLAILPFYLFIFPLLFFLPIFPFSSIIMISVHLAPASLYAGNFFTSYWFLRFSCSVFSMISMTIFILTHSKGKR